MYRMVNRNSDFSMDVTEVVKPTSFIYFGN